MPFFCFAAGIIGLNSFFCTSTTATCSVSDAFWLGSFFLTLFPVHYISSSWSSTIICPTKGSPHHFYPSSLLFLERSVFFNDEVIHFPNFQCSCIPISFLSLFFSTETSGKMKQKTTMLLFSHSLTVLALPTISLRTKYGLPQLSSCLYDII